MKYVLTRLEQFWLNQSLSRMVKYFQTHGGELKQREIHDLNIAVSIQYKLTSTDGQLWLTLNEAKLLRRVLKIRQRQMIEPAEMIALKGLHEKLKAKNRQRRKNATEADTRQHQSGNLRS